MFIRRVLEALRWRYRAWRDRRFDRHFGLATSGIDDDLPGLGIPESMRAHANGHEPIQLDVFRDIVRDLRALGIAFPDYDFVDLGSGRGRALLLALEHGFARAIGVEISPKLCQEAKDNFARYRRRRPSTGTVEVRNGNAAEVELPGGNLLVFLYNPFDDTVLKEVLSRLVNWATTNPGDLVIVYRNAVYADLLLAGGHFEAACSRRAYCIYRRRRP